MAPPTPRDIEILLAALYSLHTKLNPERQLAPMYGKLRLLAEDMHTAALNTLLKDLDANLIATDPGLSLMILKATQPVRDHLPARPAFFTAIETAWKAKIGEQANHLLADYH